MQLHPSSCILTLSTHGHGKAIYLCTYLPDRLLMEMPPYYYTCILLLCPDTMGIVASIAPCITSPRDKTLSRSRCLVGSMSQMMAARFLVGAPIVFLFMGVRMHTLLHILVLLGV
ncbi:hypothetical protein F4808DRAFT_406441 [Astrocystis sublimbata]|nr:hypothetical protein F4808DRAFT_406441 [Astrocystis sublimbata]